MVTFLCSCKTRNNRSSHGILCNSRMIRMFKPVARTTTASLNVCMLNNNLKYSYATLNRCCRGIEILYSKTFFFLNVLYVQKKQFAALFLVLTNYSKNNYSANPNHKFSLLNCQLHKIAVKKMIFKTGLSNAITKLKRQAYTRGCFVCMKLIIDQSNV